MPIIKLSKIMKEVVEKTTINNQYTVLTSSKNGLVDQSIYFNKQVASKDNIGYKIIKRGQYTYRSMSDTGYFYINRLKNLDVGIVSPAYPVFELFTDLVIPEYLDLYFNSDLFQHQINSFSQGSTRLALKFNKLITLEIYVPSLEIQKKIVKKIDLIRNLKQNFEQNMNSFDDLVKSQFIEMFDESDFPIRKIEEVCSLKSGTTFDKSSELEFGDILYCKVSDMNLEGNEKFMIRSKTYVSNEVGLKSSIPAYSTIFPKRGGAIGTNKKRLLIKDTCVDLNTMGVTPSNKINPEYLYQYFQNLDLGSLCDGSTIPQLNNKNIGPLSIKVPPIELQNKFADFVQQIDKSKYFKELPIFITIFKYIKSKLY